MGCSEIPHIADGRDAKYISINSMYVADDEKQRGKMAHEFYQDMRREMCNRFKMQVRSSQIYGVMAA